MGSAQRIVQQRFRGVPAALRLRPGKAGGYLRVVAFFLLLLHEMCDHAACVAAWGADVLVGRTE